MKLHDAMVECLLRASVPLTSADLARHINEARLYRRADGVPVPASQVSARAAKYPHLFRRIDGRIALSVSSLPPCNVPLVRLRPRETMTASDGTASRPGAAGLLADFREVGPIEELHLRGLPEYEWLASCGVYALVVPPGFRPNFVAPSAARAKRNCLNPWTVARLEQKWVPGADVVYIGLAGLSSPRPLRARLRDLLRHYAGHTTDRGPHCGGEIVWQLHGADALTLLAEPTSLPPEPRAREEQLLHDFVRRHGRLPFGNRRR